jgi:membrane protease YdiL (CAAX protease family)
MALAWIPTGVVAGLLLTRLTRLRPIAAAAACAGTVFAILASSTAASESVSHNVRLAGRLEPALTRSGLWAAVALAVIGSLLPALAAAARRRRVAAASAGSAGATAGS